MEDIFVPVTMFLSIVVVLYIYFTTRNKERLALIEKGADPSLFKSQQGSGYSTFKWGMFMVGIAVGLLVATLITAAAEVEEVPIYFSMVLIFGGLSLLASYLLKSRLEKKYGGK